MDPPPEPTHATTALRAIANHQHHALIAVGCQVVVLIVGAALARGAESWDIWSWRRLMLLVAAVLAATVIQGAAFALLLGVRLAGAGSGLLLGAAACVPVAGMAAVLGACAWGTRILREHGVRVGPLGVRPADLAALDERAEWEVRGDEGW